MKAGIVFTGTGPILVLTACDSLDDPRVVRQLNAKGILKYIAYEIPFQRVKQQYGQHVAIVMGDFSQSDELRVVDYDGHHVFYNFSFDELGEPVYYETPSLRKAA
jgi:hypothetical protein